MTIVGTGSGPDHMGVIGSMIITVASGGLGFMDAVAGRYAVIQAPDRFIRRPARHVHADGNIDAVVLHPLKPADGLTEDDAGARILAGHVEDFSSSADLISGEDRQRLVEGSFQCRPTGAA